jgi:hypothetical protein
VRPLFVPLLAALVLAEGAAASRFALHAGAPDARDRAPLRHLGLGDEARLVQPVPVPRGYGPPQLDESDRLLAVESALGVPSLNVAGRVDTFDGYTGVMPYRFKRLDLALGDAFGEHRFVAMRRFAVTHATVPGEMDPAFRERARIALEGARAMAASSPWFSAWELPHRPRAFFATATVSVPTEDAAVRELLRVLAVGTPEVVVEGNVPRAPAPGRVLRVERAPSLVRIEAESAGEGLLVLNDAYWPGWQARIDGRPVEILCADTAVRAIPWPAGRHMLIMRYEPPELRIGIATSAVGALGLVAVTAMGAWQRRGRARRELAGEGGGADG